MIFAFDIFAINHNGELYLPIHDVLISRKYSFLHRLCNYVYPNIEQWLHTLSVTCMYSDLLVRLYHVFEVCICRLVSFVVGGGCRFERSRVTPPLAGRCPGESCSGGIGVSRFAGCRLVP